MSAWKATLFDAHGARQLGTIEVPGGPQCGEDFCESCEDCMSCHPCGHFRIVYEDQLEGFLAEHEGAVLVRDAM